MLAVLGLSVLGCGSRKQREGLPRLFDVPAFELASHHGESVSAADLRGRVWVANFMFTSCPTVCPTLTKKMAGLHGRLRSEGNAVWFVSFSVDPKVDTPSVLMDYAKDKGALHGNWLFLTGPLGNVRTGVVDGFKQAMAAMPEGQGEPGDILHGTHFALIDRAGSVRGFYRSDEEGMADLHRDARRLTREGG